MKKYFNSLGFIAKENLSRLLSKFVVLFFIIPSLTLPQLAWAATATSESDFSSGSAARPIPTEHAALVADRPVEAASVDRKPKARTNMPGALPSAQVPNPLFAVAHDTTGVRSTSVREALEVEGESDHREIAAPSSGCCPTRSSRGAGRVIYNFLVWAGLRHDTPFTASATGSQAVPNPLAAHRAPSGGADAKTLTFATSQRRGGPGSARKSTVAVHLDGDSAGMGIGASAAYLRDMEKVDPRASHAPMAAGALDAVINPMASVHTRAGADSKAAPMGSPAGTGIEAALIVAERGSPHSDPDSTSAGSGGSDSPPQTGGPKGPTRAAAPREDAWSDEEEADVEKGEPVARVLATTVAEPDGATHIRNVHERLTTLLKTYIIKAKAGTSTAADQEAIQELLRGYKSEGNTWKPGENYPELRKALEVYNAHQAKSKLKAAKGVTPPEDPDEKRRKELVDELKTLETGKAFNEFMVKLFDPETSRTVWGQRLATFILTGLLGYELRGEWGILIDKTLSALSTSKPLFYYMYYTNDGMNAIGRVNKFITANTGLALSPYVSKRSNIAVQRMTPELEKRSIMKPIPIWATVLGATVTTIAALGNAGMPAYSTYENNILNEGTSLYAKSVPLFFFAFNFLDQMLRISTLRDRIFAKVFVNRGSPYTQDRMNIIEQLRAAKRIIYRMTPEQLLTLDNDLKSLSRKSQDRTLTSEELQGLRQYQKLISLGEKAPRIAASQKLKSYIRRYGPAALAAIIALGGAYLSYTTAQETATSAYKYLETNIPNYSLFETSARYAAEIYQEQMGQRDYDLWQASLGGAIYNGFRNLTDWCSQCFLGTIYDYPLTDPGYEGCSYIWFYDCPGTQPKYYLFNRTAGEFDYAPASCNNFFSIVDREHRDAPTDAYYTLALQYNAPWLLNTNGTSTYEITTSGKAIAGTVASISAIATYGLGALNAVNFFKRWIDSFSSKPYEAMPGKQNRIYSAISMPLAAIESIFRASPVAITGWLVMKDSNMNPGLMWTILVAATFTNAATYFSDFDDVYSSLPRWAQRSWAWGKQVVGKLAGIRFKEADLVNVKKDELLIKVDEMIRVLTMADDSIIKILK